MKVAIVTVLYKKMIDDFYSEHPELRSETFLEQKSKFELLVSLWAGSWARAFAMRGWEASTVVINNDILQRTWAREKATSLYPQNHIVLEQIRQFSPDILWYDYFDAQLLKQLRQHVPSIRLVLGWSGSVVVDQDVLKETDFLISCAPEVVDWCRRQGLKAHHLHHAFDAGLLRLLPSRSNVFQFTFVGQIFRGNDLHKNREELLTRFVEALDLKIFSPASSLGVTDIFRYSAKKMGSFVLALFTLSPTIAKFARQNYYLKEINRARNSSWLPYNMRLRRRMRPPVFGVQMLATLRQSAVVLNVHADSSSLFASNMRLFETTGAGACLLTDWKKNINDLFEEGRDVVTYRSTEECIEKAQWLFDHPNEREEIAQRGQQRTLKEHSFERRIDELLELLKKIL